MTQDRRAILSGLVGAGMFQGEVASSISLRSSLTRRVSPTSTYDRAIVIDSQGGIGDPDPNSVPGDPLSKMMINDLRSSGVTVVGVTVGPVGSGAARYQDTLKDIAVTSTMAANAPDHLQVVLRADDIHAAKVSGRTGLIFTMQDTTALEREIDRIGILRIAGVRVIQLTYNQSNLCGDGALSPRNGGITEFGRQVIGELERCSVLLDLSHGGQNTIAEAIATATRPMAITHTGCRALVDNPRNVHDLELRALADKGGVVGIYFMPFLRKAGMAKSEDVLRHLEHAVKICGEDHVGIGTDGPLSTLVIDDKARERQRKFVEARKAQGIAAPGEAADVFNIVEDYNFPRRLAAMAEDLHMRGWKDTRIEKVLGGNFWRLYRETWDA